MYSRKVPFRIVVKSECILGSIIVKQDILTDTALKYLKTGGSGKSRESCETGNSGVSLIADSCEFGESDFDDEYYGLRS